ncbi:hypothetical protein Pmani_016798 [Petrolisthes manimaculis]|uniref:TB domain-containing protein n=1 Tax=Petrolisthes manimaculis TaxID=1843537 RepID=A0AAE1PR02_9EUCA|nr:hypothetical protein Pmani_016798 [Petrolisthes manimaculis]
MGESLYMGSCWRLKRRDGSCGRLLRAGVTRTDCCSDRHRRAWSPTAATSVASSYTTTVAAAAALKPFNATPVVTLDVLTAEGSCSPCASES